MLFMESFVVVDVEEGQLSSLQPATGVSRSASLIRWELQMDHALGIS